MSLRVWLSPINTLAFLEGGGHLWAYLNWALGLRALGADVTWLEWVADAGEAARRERDVRVLRERLRAHGVTLALAAWNGERLPAPLSTLCPGLADADGADLLLNFRYGCRPEVVSRFRRSALVDIDPGLLQVWMSEGQIEVARHDVYFTIGETVGRPGSRCPDGGVPWQWTPPPVHLDAWPPVAAPPGAPYTTVSTWWGEWLKWGGELLANDKRASFLEFAALPRVAGAPLELALCLGEGDDADRRLLEGQGWRVRDAREVGGTAEGYRGYIQRSRGEFSCAKPSCMRLQNAWISDRTICYLASGKPAVVQHTGPSRFLPDRAGLLRFRDVEEAARRLREVEADYERHCRLARALAEEHFDARTVVARVLERALG